MFFQLFVKFGRFL